MNHISAATPTSIGTPSPTATDYMAPAAMSSPLALLDSTTNSQALRSDSLSITACTPASQPTESLTAATTDSSLTTLFKLPPQWMDVSFGSPDIRLCQVTYQDKPSYAPLVVTRSLVVKEDQSWTIHVHGRLVDPVNIPSLKSFPSSLSSNFVDLLLSKLANLNTCIGNPEEKYVALGEKKKNGMFLSNKKNVVAFVDRYACVFLGQEYSSTIRCSKCHLLTSDVRCSVCTKYRKSLNSQISQGSHLTPTNPVRGKKVNYRY